MPVELELQGAPLPVPKSARGRELYGRHPRRAALLVIVAALLFAIMGAMVKVASRSLPNEMVVFFRNVLGWIVLLPWVLRGGAPTLQTRHLHLHALRAVSGLTSMYCFFYAIAHLQLANAILLNYAAPLFIPFIAALWLREPFPVALRWASVVGFIGIAFILKPDRALLDPAALVGLAAGVFTAVAFVSIRRMAATEPTTRIVFYFSTSATLISAVPLAWAWVRPEPTLWGVLVAIGMVATLAQLMLTRAYAYAPAARVGPFGYSIVLFGALIGWVLWGETPDRLSLFGALLVCCAGILTTRRTRIG